MQKPPKWEENVTSEGINTADEYSFITLPTNDTITLRAENGLTFSSPTRGPGHPSPARGSLFRFWPGPLFTIEFQAPPELNSNPVVSSISNYLAKSFAAADSIDSMKYR